MAELHRSPYKRPEIDQMVKDGVLSVHSFSDKENVDVVAYYAKMAVSTNLSLTDCAVLKYSKDNGYLNDDQFHSLKIDNDCILKILTSIVKTMKQKIEDTKKK